MTHFKVYFDSNFCLKVKFLHYCKEFNWCALKVCMNPDLRTSRPLTPFPTKKEKKVSIFAIKYNLMID